MIVTNESKGREAGAAAGPRIIVALDYDSAEAALSLAERLDPSLCRLKVGKELFTACGPRIVTDLTALGFDIFLDLKFHDIPNTVARAVKMAADLGVWMVNVHASGGRRMMRAAREVLDSRQGTVPLLIGVTVLTSMETDDLAEVGVDGTPENQVLRLARLTQSCGLDGVVCSAREAVLLRRELGQDFCLVTPGIRTPGIRTPGITPPASGALTASAEDDQRRVVTPADATAAGSSYLVIGRPITQALDPVAVCREIAASIIE